MPTLARLNSCKITLYAADHLPPHFHVLANDGHGALMAIANLVILAGNAGARTPRRRRGLKTTKRGCKHFGRN